MEPGLTLADKITPLTIWWLLVAAPVVVGMVLAVEPEDIWLPPRHLLLQLRIQ
jgi:hypothetical protein